MELVFSDLKKTFPAREGEPGFALQLPQLKFTTGTCVFLMGHNGSGKSVTVKLLTGEIKGDNGRVKTTVESKPTVIRFGVVRQQSGESLALDLTVRENLMLRRQPKSLWEWLFPHASMAGYVETTLSIHGELKRKIDQPCRNLSGGQRQILSFLCATSQSPRLLLLDEFLSATDLSATKLLRRLAKEYCVQNSAIVLVVSHNTEMALEDADEIVILRKGMVDCRIEKNDSKWNKEFIVEHVKE